MTMRKVILALVAILAVSVSTGCAAAHGTSVPTAAPPPPTVPALTATPLPTAALAQTATPLPTASPFPTPPIPADVVPRIAVQELKAELDAGKPLVVADVRSREAYDEKHIDGAISMPLAELEQRLSELPESEDIVLYCT